MKRVSLIVSLLILFATPCFAEENISIPETTEYRVDTETLAVSNTYIPLDIINQGPYYVNNYIQYNTDPFLGFKYYECIPLSEDLQKYLWKKCNDIGMDYALALAFIQRESEFNPRAGHSNKNGSYDRGLMQINSCWVKKFKKLGYINSGEDLYDPYTSINCAMYLLQEYVATVGNCEQTYAWYNTGNPKIKSNKNSRVVMQYWEEWKAKLKTE